MKELIGIVVMAFVMVLIPMFYFMLVNKRKKKGVYSLYEYTREKFYLNDRYILRYEIEAGTRKLFLKDLELQIEMPVDEITARRFGYSYRCDDKEYYSIFGKYVRCILLSPEEKYKLHI